MQPQKVKFEFVQINMKQVSYLGGATGLGDGRVSLGGFCGGKATGGNLLAGSFLGSYTTAISFELYPNIVPVKR